ncbi:unnamed protein product, partial [Didymodactylos carnosus]
RPNKPDDSCYSFWIGATLKMLNAFDFIDVEKNLDFLHSTENSITGGFSKWPNSSADPLHSYLSLAALSLMSNPSLNELHPALIVSQNRIKYLKNELHSKW